jgi:hypothetical protein
MLLERFVRRVGDEEIDGLARQGREPADGVLRGQLERNRGHTNLGLSVRTDAQFYDGGIDAIAQTVGSGWNVARVPDRAGHSSSGIRLAIVEMYYRRVILLPLSS